MKSDLERIAECLDEHIIKGLRIGKSNSNISKALSFDPDMPHTMGFDSPYYNPYRYIDGGWAPHPVEYWETQGKNPDGYATTRDFYARIAPVKKSISSFNDLIKAIDKKPETAGLKPLHPRVQKVHDHIRDRKVMDRAKQEAIRETLSHVREAVGHLFDGDEPKQLGKFFEEKHKRNDNGPSAEESMEGLHKELSSQHFNVVAHLQYQGKEYKYTFKDIAASTPKEAQDKVAEGVEAKLKGAKIINLKASAKSSPKDAKVESNEKGDKK